MNLFFHSGPCCLSSMFLMEEHHCAKIRTSWSTGTLNFMFTNILFLLCPKGKEYVCIVRLHEAIENESELAKVGTLNLNFILRILQLIFKIKISIPSVLFAVKHTRLQPGKSTEPFSCMCIIPFGNRHVFNIYVKIELN